MRSILISTIVAFWATTTSANDQALLLGVERYANLDRVNGANDIADAVDALKSVGFDVLFRRNAGGPDMTERLTDFVPRVEAGDTLVVGLSGAFVWNGDRTWLLPLGASDPSLFNLAGALSVESVMQVMAASPGQALLVLGRNNDADETYDSYLRGGLGDLDIPSGVTVVTGNPRGVANFVEAIAVPGADAMVLARRNDRLSVEGFAPQSLVLVAEDVTPVVVPDIPVPTAADIVAETSLWDGAKALDTAEAYRNYLTRYPNGTFVDEAESLILEITTEPHRADRLAEESLTLNRDARRAIQRNLTTLNFNPRGVDGIFGPGTRSALSRWQQQNGFTQTSFLTRNQINRLDAQAARRTAELEAEAAREQAERRQQDRAFWAETGAEGDEAGLRAYLDRFPSGAFATNAKEQLNTIEQARNRAAANQERTAWETATNANTQRSYQRYLQTFPEGSFVAEANSRITGLRTPRRNNNAAAEAEAALGLDGITSRLIEARLAQLGLQPGTVDGRFDRNSRRAIRNFQQANDIGATGFINQQTIARLLVGGRGGN